jgi:thymidylate synthase (FAD)
MGGSVSPWSYPEGGPLAVRLLYSTPDPERSIAVAGRLCYTERTATELTDAMSDEEVLKILKTLITSGHHAALEHASYTFALSGVSRAMTHQLVRHRVASYNQQSQRYVSYGDGMKVVKPASIEAELAASVRFDALMGEIYEVYKDLIAAGVPAEDARYVLPNAKTSEIVVTMNVRELLHFFELRCCKRAQWEIREAADQMLALATETSPYIFMDAGASCRRGVCKEGNMTCGDPFPRADKRT